ncbi:MAG TPA: YsnF/AvaK domain-containing protein [Oligoflexus sp.]|uniref:YsnF/AvaK domain-containing protein n=1 Tax=Oligoflexus sp. TaxID=1971216 RepID=UPI002D64F700|nr:YsnF/AvaK domain-containing protein [Oligoflexus sp.]HYX36473.1 YsnF/AvaK domain-containing protein [Oligoflexus sp.]
MQTGSRTIVGVFSDLSDAQRATDELRSLGVSAVRLVENDQDVTFTGTSERQGASSTYSSNTEPKKTGISAFFARLFGFDDDRPSWNMSQDSEAYFQDAYNNKHHLVIVEDSNDISVCREVIARFGGRVEEQGSQFYESELYRDQGLAGTRSSLDSDRSGLNDQSLSGTRTNFDRDLGLSGTRTDMDRDQSLMGTRTDMDRDLGLSDTRTDISRDQSLSGNRLDSTMETSMDSDRVMELREEQLDVYTERMQTGEVQLRKEIVTETRTIEVPVTREEIVVERRPLDGEAREGSLETAGLDMESKEIRIPVSEEFVHIDKKVVPREEIRVSKDKITETKSVSEEVRREEAHVDSDGRVSIKDRRDTTIPPITSTRGQDKIQPGV